MPEITLAELVKQDPQPWFSLKKGGAVYEPFFWCAQVVCAHLVNAQGDETASEILELLATDSVFVIELGSVEREPHDWGDPLEDAELQCLAGA